MADKSDREGKSRLVLAERLRTLQAADFLDFQDIVRHVNVKNFLPHGLATLAKLTTFLKIAGALYDNAEHLNDKEVALSVWTQALKGELPFYEELLTRIPANKLPGIFQHWLVEEGCVTWEHLTIAFPYSVLRSCASEGDQRADDAVSNAEVIEEDLEEIDADTGEPPK